MSIDADAFRALLARIAQADDASVRQALVADAEHAYFRDLAAQANYVQARFGDLELDIRDQVQQSLGATNDMISATLDEARQTRHAVEQQGAAADELRGMFHGLAAHVGTFGERFDHLSDRVAALETKLHERDAFFETFDTLNDQVHLNSARIDRIDRFIQMVAGLPAAFNEWQQSVETELASFRQSRDASIAERKALRQLLTDQDRRRTAQWQEISDRLAALEAHERASGAP